MAYATIADVQRRVRPRQFTGSSNPTLEDVTAFLDDAAAELDGILLGRGYVLPVRPQATVALGVLRRANAIGAWAMVEQAAPTGKEGQADRAQQEWAAVQRGLRGRGPDRLELDLPQHTQEVFARARTRSDLTDTPGFFPPGLEL